MLKSFVALKAFMALMAFMGFAFSIVFMVFIGVAGEDAHISSYIHTHM